MNGRQKRDGGSYFLTLVFILLHFLSFERD